MSVRVKGQETAIFITADGNLLDTLTDVKSSEFTLELEIKQEGYQGQTTDQYDEVFHGVSGRMEYHFSDEAPFTLMQTVVDRARRRVAGAKINIQTTVNLPNGKRKRVLLPDVAIGGMPMNFPSRADYVSSSLEFKGSDFKFL